MNKILITLTFALLTAGQVFASEETQVMASVQQLVNAFNKSDTKSLLAICADDMCIIDEFAPYEWHGPGTCSKWLADYDADAKKNGISDGRVTIEKPYVAVGGDRAYVVARAGYTFKQNGKPVEESGATWTFTLQKSDAGWRVTGWAWAKPKSAS